MTRKGLDFSDYHLSRYVLESLHQRVEFDGTCDKQIEIFIWWFKIESELWSRVNPGAVLRVGPLFRAGIARHHARNHKPSARNIAGRKTPLEKKAHPTIRGVEVFITVLGSSSVPQLSSCVNIVQGLLTIWLQAQDIGEMYVIYSMCSTACRWRTRHTRQLRFDEDDRVVYFGCEFRHTYD